MYVSPRTSSRRRTRRCSSSANCLRTCDSGDSAGRRFAGGRCTWARAPADGDDGRTFWDAATVLRPCGSRRLQVLATGGEVESRAGVGRGEGRAGAGAGVVLGRRVVPHRREDGVEVAAVLAVLVALGELGVGRRRQRDARLRCAPRVVVVVVVHGPIAHVARDLGRLTSPSTRAVHVVSQYLSKR